MPSTTNPLGTVIQGESELALHQQPDVEETSKEVVPPDQPRVLPDGTVNVQSGTAQTKAPSPLLRPGPAPSFRTA